MSHSRSSSESRRLRIADELNLDELGRVPDGPAAGAPCVVASVGTGATAAFCAVTAQTVTGTETQGTAATLTSVGSTFYALNLGGTSPPSGMKVICTYVASRWVFRYD